MMGVQAAASIDDKTFQRTVEHVERVATMRPGQGELSLDAVDIAQPSDMMAPPSGIERTLE